MDIRFQLITPRKYQSCSTRKKTTAKEVRLSPSQYKGLAYEQEAIEYLNAQGLQLLEKNLSCKFGEIDLVMKEGNMLVLIEVRTRQNKRYGGAISSITKSKQQKLQRTAAHFLPYLIHKHFQGQQPFCRFDAFCFQEFPQEKFWLKNIFI